MKVLEAVFRFLLLVLIFSLFLSCAKVKTVVFKNINVIPMTSETVLENQDVYVKGNQIEAIVESGTGMSEEADIVIDGKGKYLMPGLADMHVHVYQNPSGSDLPLYIANGVTTIRDCNGREFILNFKRDIEKGKRVGPQILCATQTIRGWEKEPWTLVKERFARGYDLVKFYSYFESPDAFHKAMAEAKEAGAYTMGHIPYTVGLDGVIQEGMDEIAHVEEIAWEFADIDKSQSLKGDQWLRYIVGRYIQKYGRIRANRIKNVLMQDAEKIIQKLHGKDIAVTTTCHYTHTIGKKINEREHYIQNPHLKYLPPEYFINVGLGQEKHQAQFGEIKDLVPVWASMLETLLIQLHTHGILVAGGTDAIWDMGLVPGFSLHDELAYFVEIGLTPYEALKMCTINAGEVARRMKGLEKSEFGTVEAGQRADLVLLDHNPLEDINHIRMNSGVMADGKWYSKKACSELLAFDEKRYQAYLDLFQASRSLKKNDESLLDTFLQKTEFEDLKTVLYKHRDISKPFIQLLYKNNKTDRVKAFFNNAVKSNWDDVNYLNAIAWNAGVEMKIEAIYPDAVKATQRALELRKHAGIFDTLAWMYALNGAYENALNAIKEAKRLDPENKTWDEMRDKILEMKNG